MNPAVKKALRWSLLGLLLVVLLLIAVIFFIRWRTIGQWNDFKAHWEAKGEHFDIEHYIPDPVPDDRNLASHPWFADLPANGATPGTPLAVIDIETIEGFADPIDSRHWLRCEPADFSHWGDLAEGLDEEQIARQLLARMEPMEEAMDQLSVLLAERTACRYPDGWEETLTREVRQLFAFMTFAKASTMRATLRIQSGQGQEAAEDLTTLLRLANHAGQEPSLVGHLVEVAITQQFCAGLWEGLRANAFDEPTLARLSAALPASGALAQRSLQSLRFERSSFLQIIDHLEEGKHLGAAPGGDQPAFLKLWWASNRLAICEDFQNHLFAPGGTFATRPTVAGAEAVELNFEKRRKGLTRFTQTFALMVGPAVTGSIAKTLTVEAHLNHARIAIALERHRLAHGSYPATLSALVPQFLPAVPTDLINARPIEYRLKSDGTPLIYQWGCDGDDDGASPRRKPLHGDIVWQYSIDPPLTEREFQQED